MPNKKIKSVKKLNPQAEGMMNKLIGDLYKCHKVVINQDDLMKIKETTVFTPNNDFPEFLDNFVSDIQGHYQIPFNYKVHAKIITPTLSSSKNDRILHDPPANTMSRVVGVFFSHEVFSLPTITKLLSNTGVLVPQSSVIKVSSDQARLKFNDKGFYDVNKYPGKGFKRPEKRYIIVIDFVSEDPEDIKKEQAKEIENISNNSSGLISNLAKMMGIKRNG